MITNAQNWYRTPVKLIKVLSSDRDHVASLDIRPFVGKNRDISATEIFIFINVGR